MIRYFDQITPNPTAEDVAGKIIFAVGIMNFRSFRKPGRVTRVSGDRVYFDPIDTQGLGSLNAKNYIFFKSIGAVCDTEEEAQAIIDLNKQALNSYQAHMRAMSLEINCLFNDLIQPKETQSE